MPVIQPSKDLQAGGSLSEKIRRMIVQAIESGIYPPGSQLPTERELATHYGVSLAPVRAALAELANAGSIERNQGRGTFIREKRVAVELSFRPNITGMMKQAGIDYRIEVVELVQTYGPRDVAEKLKCSRSTKLICVRRSLFFEGAVAAVMCAWLPAKRFNGLLKDKALAEGASLYSRLDELYGVVPKSIEATLAVASADGVVSNIMGVSFGTPTMELSTLSVDQHGEIVECGTVNYDASRFIFNLRTPYP